MNPNQGTPIIPPHIQLEAAKRQLALMIRQRDIAESSIKQLSDALAELQSYCVGGMKDTAGLAAFGVAECATALSALISTQLAITQMNHENLVERVLELEGALKVASDFQASGLVIPRMGGLG